MDALERYAAALTGSAAEIGAVRRAVLSMADCGGLSERGSDLALALAEIIANAQEHGGSPISVRAWLDGRLVVEVHDTGRGFDHRQVFHEHPPAPLARRGRGLWIVRQLVDHMVITTGPSGTTIRIELVLEPQIGA